MDHRIDQRIASVIAARQAREAIEHAEASHSAERRAERALVLDELPRFGARLSAAIAEINDRLENEHVSLRLGETTRSPVLEAVYTVGIHDNYDDESENAALALNVDFRGRVSSILKKGDVRALINSCLITEMDGAHMLEILVQLLEFRYNPNA